MRKRLITRTPETVPSGGEGWLDLERAAVVEATSEDNDFPVESALVPGETRGWRAAMPGTETIRLVFDQPQKLKQISLVFEEKEIARTQEFVLRWSFDGGISFREIVRQQWTSALLRQYVRSRNIKLSFQTSPYSNCPSCRIRVADLLAPRSKVCGCFEVVTRIFPNPSRE